MIKHNSYVLNSKREYLINGFSGLLWNKLNDNISTSVDDFINFNRKYNDYRNYWLKLFEKTWFLLKDYDSDINYKE